MGDGTNNIRIEGGNWFDKLLALLWILASAVLLLLLKSVEFLFLAVRFAVLTIFRANSRKNDVKQMRRGGSAAKLAKRFDLWMRGSKWARRVGFAALALTAAYLAYPPSHWGPWHRYQTGIASYYSTGFWFKRTANGEIFIPLFMTAAHKTLPLGTFVKVKNVATGKCVYVKINDRGPFIKGRILDLSSFAAWRLGIHRKGTGKVIIYTKTHIRPPKANDIRK